MRRPHQDSAANAGPHLPYAVETLPQKIARFLPAEENFGGSHSDDLFSSSISSRPSKKISIANGVLLNKAFHSSIKNTAFGIREIKKIMKVDANAKKLVNKYSFSTVQNTI